MTSLRDFLPSDLRAEIGMGSGEWDRRRWASVKEAQLMRDKWHELGLGDESEMWNDELVKKTVLTLVKLDEQIEAEQSLLFGLLDT